MTIYSGFATRKQQQRYDAFILKAIQMLSQIVITYVESSKIQPFHSQFQKMFNALSKMDTLKHSNPKISLSLYPLAEHFRVFAADDLSEIGSDLTQSNAKAHQKRPLTSNFVKQKRISIELERNTINITPNKKKQAIEGDHKKTYSQVANKRYQSFGKKPDRQRKEIRSHSFTTKHSRLKQVGEKLELYHITDTTMEELMEKNRLVQRKMSMFRKKKYIHQSKIPAKIQQLDEEDQLSFL